MTVEQHEPPNEHLRNALQLLHNLRSYEMISQEAVRHEKTLNAITNRINLALAQIELR